MKKRSQKRRHTLSGRLVLLFVIMATLIVVTINVTIMWLFRSHFQENIRPHLMQYLFYIEQDIGTPPVQAKAITLSQQLNIDIHYLSENQQWDSNNNRINLDAIRYHRQFKRQGVEYGFGYFDDREYLITRHKDYTLAFSVPRREFSGWHIIVPLLVILTILVVLYQATRRLFSPIREIRNGISRIGAGELDHRIDVKLNNELGELADSINIMADDIQHMLDAKRQLLLAISHELRTPLTRAKVSAAMLDDEHQQIEIQRELDEMETLIEQLLETERLSTRHHILNKSRTDIKFLISQLLRQYFSGQEIVLDLPCNTINMMVDSARIKLLLKNILSNALQYNPDHANPPTLSLVQHDTSININIRDHGPGIDPEHLSHLTEPFYRTDAARQRRTGGYGLGLYLCKVITEAHGGKLMLESKIGKGTTVVISLPLEAPDN